MVSKGNRVLTIPLVCLLHLILRVRGLIPALDNFVVLPSLFVQRSTSLHLAHSCHSRRDRLY